LSGGSTIFGFALSANGKECFSPILDTDADPDHHRNPTTSLKISAKSVCNFLRNPANKPTDKQINAAGIT